jgi:hypothetical protein
MLQKAFEKTHQKHTTNRIKKTLKKIEAKEKKVTGNIEKKGTKKKPLTTKKK